MKESQLLERISINPEVMVGKPAIKGTRLTVEYILSMLAHGSTSEEILQEWIAQNTRSHIGTAVSRTPAMQSDTQPRRDYLVAFPEVPWLRGCVSDCMAGVRPRTGRQT